MNTCSLTAEAPGRTKNSDSSLPSNFSSTLLASRSSVTGVRAPSFGMVVSVGSRWWNVVAERIRRRRKQSSFAICSLSSLSLSLFVLVYEIDRRSGNSLFKSGILGWKGCRSDLEEDLAGRSVVTESWSEKLRTE